MSMYRLVADSPAVPWRLRNGLERWLESSCRERSPALYRWFHFGEARDRLQAVTAGPEHHFFGYYEKSPWNASGSLMLAHEASFNDRPPGPEDAVEVGIVRPADSRRFEPLGLSHAWNWQQGAMLQWHPADPERVFLHNDRRDGHFVGVVRDIEGRELGRYERPIYAVSPDGHHAYSVNFARLQTHRPGYGYAGCTDAWADDASPAKDGIHRTDLASGESALIVSLHQLAHADPRADMHNAFHWINHVQVAPNGSRLAFFHIWRIGDAGWRARLYTCNPDGSRLNCLLDADFVSHYDWLDEHRILIWARDEGRRGQFWLLDEADGSRNAFASGILTEDGHCSYSPDRRWVLNDTYPDRYDMRTLMLVRWPEGRRIDLARLYSPKSRWWGEIRCDLHPRWRPDGKQICVDSVHDGTRQMYVMDVSRWIE